MLAKSGGARTVPQIFIGDTHVGGCDELYALEREGKLDPLLGLIWTFAAARAPTMRAITVERIAMNKFAARRREFADRRCPLSRRPILPTPSARRNGRRAQAVRARAGIPTALAVEAAQTPIATCRRKA